MKIEDFEGAEPGLVLEDYFDGRLRAWGLFQDRFGTVRRQFTVDIVGDVEGDTLTLTEDFRYDDGETERRVWTLRCVGKDRYVGTADGVVGEATGRVAGNAFNWRYVFDLPYGDGTIRVRFDDWMFLQDDGVLLNKAIVTKWGIEVGTAFITFRRVDDRAEGTETA